MATNNIEITLKAKDLASKVIGNTGRSIDKLGKESKFAETGVKGLSTGIGTLGTAASVALGVTGLTVAIGLLSVATKGLTFFTTDAFSAFNDFETGMSGMQKTIKDTTTGLGITKKEAKEMSYELSNIDTATTVKDLQNIARIGGQMGLTSDEITGFAKSVDKISVALSDEFSGGSEEVANVVGGLLTQFGELKGTDTEKTLTSIGSALNSLGSDSRATAGNIAEFARRTKGAVPQVGIKQMLAFGAALETVGVNAERGSSGFANIIDVASRNTSKWASALGTSEDNVKNLINNDVPGLFKAISNSTKNLTEQEVSVWLSDLKVNSMESAQVVNGLKNNIEILDNAINTSSESFDSATSIQEEFDTVMGTNTTSMDKLGKASELAQVKVGDVLDQIFKAGGGDQILKGLVGEFSKFFDGFVIGAEKALPKLKEAFGDLGESIDNLLKTFGLLSEESTTTETMGENFGESMINGITFVVEKLTEVSEWFIANEPVISAFLSDISAGFTNTGKVIGVVVSVITTIVTTMQTVSNIFWAVAGVVEEVISTIKAVITGVGVVIGNMFSVNGVPLGVFVGNILGGARGIIAAAVAQIKSLFSGITDSFIGGLNTALGLLRTIKSVASGGVGKAVGSSLSSSVAPSLNNAVASLAPRTKQFAEGGFVDGIRMGNGRDNLLVKAEKGEMILNEKQQNSIQSQMGGGGFVINGNITVNANNPQEFMNQIQAYFARNNSLGNSGYRSNFR